MTFSLKQVRSAFDKTVGNNYTHQNRGSYEPVNEDTIEDNNICKENEDREARLIDALLEGRITQDTFNKAIGLLKNRS